MNVRIGSLTAAERPPGSELDVIEDEEFYRLIADSIPHIVFTATSDGSTDYLNRQGTSYTGQPAEINYGWDWLSLVHPADVARARDAWVTSKRTGAAYRLDYRIRRFDGQYRWHAFRARPVRGSDGGIMKWIGTATEIEDAVETSELLQTLQEAAPIGFGFVDRDYRYVRVNQRLADMNGRSIEEHLGRTVAEIVPDLWPQIEPAYRRVLAGSAVIGENLTGTTAAASDGTHYWLVDMYPVRVREEIRGIGLVVVDITERREAEEAHARLLNGVIGAIAATIDARDPYTAGHQRRVAGLSVAIAGALGLDPYAIEGINLAATIHDIGKIAIPAEILSRPGTLRPAEWELMKSHCQEGYEILRPIEFPWPVADMVLQHHERWDGSGYPHGLRGEEIQRGARVIAVADVVEAMASHRPYRPARGIDAALREIEQGRGRLFEGDVVDACLELFREGRLQLD